MTAQSPTMMRCERCRAVISTTRAAEFMRRGVPCGVCGGTLALCDRQRRARSGDEQDGGDRPPPSAERRLLDVLRAADGQPVGRGALAQAGIQDPANTIFELERAGYRIERAYDASTGRRRFLGYRLWNGAGRLGAQRSALGARGSRLPVGAIPATEAAAPSA